MAEKKNRTRHIEKKVRLTSDENIYIKNKMASVGVKNFNAFALNMMIQGKVNQINFEELKELRVAINRIGNNINQIAKHVNESEAVSQQDILSIKQLFGTMSIK